jgi:hypothetical protein
MSSVLIRKNLDIETHRGEEYMKVQGKDGYLTRQGKRLSNLTNTLTLEF